MKYVACFFMMTMLLFSKVHSATAPEVIQCLEIPDADFNAQLDCLDPILAQAKAQLDSALKARISSLGNDKKAIKVLQKQQKDWEKKLDKSLCPNSGRPQDIGYQVACEIDQANKRSAELSK